MSVHYPPINCVLLILHTISRNYNLIKQTKKIYNAMCKLVRKNVLDPRIKWVEKLDWRIKCVEKFTSQTDATSCGVYVCFFFECLAIGVSLGNGDGENLTLKNDREWIAFSLCMGRKIGLYNEFNTINVIVTRKAKGGVGVGKAEGMVNLPIDVDGVFVADEASKAKGRVTASEANED